MGTVQKNSRSGMDDPGANRMDLLGMFNKKMVTDFVLLGYI